MNELKQKKLHLKLGGIMLLAVIFGQVLFAPVSTASAQTRQLERASTINNQTKVKRLALVIGNGAYQYTAKLENPVNDATDIAAILKDLGFEVIFGSNQTKSEMQALIRRFGNRLADTKAVGLFFYAGHGISQDGVNYLIPVDADIQSEDEIGDSSVSINFMLGKMEAANNDFNMVILDACRNNPFSRKWRNYRDIGNKGGLTRIDAPTGTLIAYATKPGEVASDGSGERNGLYTSALLKQMRVKNVELIKMLQLVRADVINRSKGKQVPYDESSVVGDFYFAGTETVNPNIERNTNVAIEKEFWDSIKNSTNAEDFKFYKEKYPNGIYANLADLKIKQLTLPIVVSPNGSQSSAAIPSNVNIAPARWEVLHGMARTLLKYDKVSSFSEGLAHVQMGDDYRKGKYGFIDRTGMEIFPLKNGYADLFSEGLAKVVSGDYKRGKFGFIDKMGKEIIPFRYDLAYSFSEGLAPVLIGELVKDKWGFIDKTGKEIIPFKYDYADSFSEGLAVVITRGWGSNSWGFIDKTGKEIIPFKYEFAGSFSEGLASVQLGGKVGFIDKTGKEIIPFKYTLALSFSEGLAAVRNGNAKNGKWGFIDKMGEEIISLKYDFIDSFSDGLAEVQLGGKWGFIDKTGKEIIPIKYDKIWCRAFRKEGFIGVVLNGKKGFVDLYGNEYFDF